MKSKISPSMMCVDYADIKGTLAAFEACGIEYLHIDVMDGVFVPNFTLGPDFCKYLKKNSRIPMDYHLMIERPEDRLGWFPISEGDYVSVHYESTKHMQKVLSSIRALGAKPMVAINPATPICMIEDLLCDLDGVLVMTVNPGFAGQKLVPATLDKIKRLRQYLDEKGYGNIEIEVDGNVSFENAKKMRLAGADIFVAGTSSLFRAGEDLCENAAKLRSVII